MKRVTTMFCALCFLIGGFIVANNKSSDTSMVSTMNAAETNNSILPNLRIPASSEMNQGTKAVPDTITVHDTVYVKKPIRAIKVPHAVKTKDTIFVPVLYVPVGLTGREEKPENVNHSTKEQLQDSCLCQRGIGLVQ